jgi:putative DNA methylase
LSKYIEADFPIERLSFLTRREKHAMKPVYQMHTWFARRAGSEFRALILATLLNEQTTEQEFWQRFYTSTDSGGPIILDPFMGGGTTIVEALRLGGRVIGVDLNPVAWFVVKKEIEPVDLEKLEKAFRQLEADAAPGIRRWYLTKCPSCRQPADIVYAYWVKQIFCESCGELTSLFQHYAIAKIGQTSWLYCPHCDGILLTAEDEQEILRNPTCPSCHLKLLPYSTGRRYTCQHCGAEGKVLDAVRKAGERPHSRLFALQYYCPYCGERGCKSPEEDDLTLYHAASEELERLKEDGPIPFANQEIPYGEETRRILNYGYRYFYELFNDRQFLCLAKLTQAIASVEDCSIREYLLLALSNALEFNNTLVPYIYNANKVESCFSLHNYLHAQVYAENNVWGTDHGRGAFTKCYEQVKRGKAYCINPFERMYKRSGGKISARKVFTHDRIEARLIDSFEQLEQGEGNALLRCQSSTDLSFLPNRSVDAVITDPPYFDNVVYSGVADLFYSWLKGILSRDYQCFRTPQSPRNEEIVVNPKVPVKSEDAYVEGLTRVFRECRRVLKDDGFLAFTFHHTKARAWFTALKAILDSGFSISAAWPIHSESRASPHAKGVRSVLYDVILVCRKRRTDGERIAWKQVEKHIWDKAQTAIAQLAWIGLKDIDLSTVIVGKSLEVYSKHYPNVFKNGRPVSIEEAIQAVEEVVEKMKTEAPVGQTREPGLFDTLDV